MLRCYVMLKAVEKIHGKRGKTFVVKLLKGSREFSVAKAVWEFDLYSLWGLFSRLNREDIADLLSDLVEKGWLYIQDVSTGGYTFPLLHISEEGKEQLHSLEETEGKRLISYLEEVCFREKNPEISDKGLLLDSFLSNLVQLLEMWRNLSSNDMDLNELISHLELDFSSAEMMEKFLYRSTPERLQDQFRTPYVVDIVCYQLYSQLRSFLSGLPEQDAMVFRCRYGLKDSLYMSLNNLIKHYGMMDRNIQYSVKRCLSSFANRNYMERYSFIAAIYNLVTESFGDEKDPIPLVKDTAQVTYEMYQKDMSISEIARERGLAISTIYSHFTRLIPKYDLKLDEILPRERIDGILQAAEAAEGKSLKAIREQLPFDYNYGEIRLVMELEKGWNAA